MKRSLSKAEIQRARRLLSEAGRAFGRGVPQLPALANACAAKLGIKSPQTDDDCTRIVRIYIGSKDHERIVPSLPDFAVLCRPHWTQCVPKNRLTLHLPSISGGNRVYRDGRVVPV